MSETRRLLVVAADPLLRKAVVETLSPLAGDGSVGAVSPTRATAERLASADLIVFAAADGDLTALGPAAAAGSNCPAMLVAVGTTDGGRQIAAKLGITADLSVAIPDLNIRGELAKATQRFEAVLREARRLQPRSATEPAAPPPTRKATAGKAAGEGPAPGPAGAAYLGMVVCIGASTGGTDALLTVLSGLAVSCPPIVIVQHMPGPYVGDFVTRLHQASAIDVAMADDGAVLRRGLALVAPGGRQCRLRKDAQGIRTVLGEADRIGGHCPAVDVLMESAARELQKRAVGVILTGMGRDGASGLLAMRRAGARTLAQDEQTSVVYGMPKVAREEGAADTVLPLPKIAGWISGLAMQAAR